MEGIRTSHLLSKRLIILKISSILKHGKRRELKSLKLLKDEENPSAKKISLYEKRKSQIAALVKLAPQNNENKEKREEINSTTFGCQLGDELLLQILKQITSNPNESSVTNGWELLYVLLNERIIFPTKDFYPYFETFVRKHRAKPLLQVMIRHDLLKTLMHFHSKQSIVKGELDSLEILDDNNSLVSLVDTENKRITSIKERIPTNIIDFPDTGDVIVYSGWLVKERNTQTNSSSKLLSSSEEIGATYQFTQRERYFEVTEKWLRYYNKDPTENMDAEASDSKVKESTRRKLLGQIQLTNIESIQEFTVPSSFIHNELERSKNDNLSPDDSLFERIPPESKKNYSNKNAKKILITINCEARSTLKKLGHKYIILSTENNAHEKVNATVTSTSNILKSEVTASPQIVKTEKTLQQDWILALRSLKKIVTFNYNSTDTEEIKAY